MADEKELCRNCDKPLPPNWKDNFCPGTKCAKEYSKKNLPPGKKSKSASLLAVAARVAASSHESLTRPTTEYGTRVEIAFSADFEGKVAKDVLVKKLEHEIMGALESSVKIISRELRLRPGRVLVKPLRIEVAMNDQASFDEDEENEEQGE